MSLNGDLNGVIEQLQRIRVGYEANVQQHKSALEEAQKELQQVDRLLRAAGAAGPKEKPKPKPSAKPLNVSDETRQAVLLAIRQLQEEGNPTLPSVPGSFTVESLAGYTEVHSSTVRNALEVMREEGAIRAVGLDPASPAPRKPMVYSYVG